MAVGLSILQALYGRNQEGIQDFRMPFAKSQTQTKNRVEVAVPETVTEKVKQVANNLEWVNAFLQGSIIGLTDFREMCVMNIVTMDNPTALESQSDLIVAQFLSIYSLNNNCMITVQYSPEPPKDFRELIKDSTEATDEQLEEGVMLLACANAGEVRAVLEEKAPEFLKALVDNYDGKWELTPKEATDNEVIDPDNLTEAQQRALFAFCIGYE